MHQFAVWRVSNGSKPAVPSTTKHSRFTFSRAAKNRYLGSHCARLPRQRKHCYPCRPTLLVAAPPGPERRACGGVSIVTGAVRIQRTKTMASKQTNKQATSAAKSERQPRRRISQGRSKSAATQTSLGARLAAVAPERVSESIDPSTNTTPSPEPQAPQSKPQSEGGELATATVPGVERPRASTKRAVLIGMLEREPTDGWPRTCLI
jgi:hypothetical protein